MPMYDFGCTSCGHYFDAYLSINERDKPTIEPCPHCDELTVKKMLLNAPSIVGGVGTARHSNEFNDRLKEIKKTAGRSNTIGNAIH